MDINFAGTDKQLLQFYIFEVLMKDQIGAQFRYVKLQIFLGEDCGLTLIVDDGHELCVDLALFSKQQRHQYEERVHNDAKFLVLVQAFDISLDHALEGGLSVFGGEKGEVEVLSKWRRTWQQWMHLQQKILARQPEWEQRYRSACVAGE